VEMDGGEGDGGRLVHPNVRSPLWGYLAGLHHAFENWRKPFNPILGETWQASLSDGTTMLMEQISHHPPVSAFHMEGPGVFERLRVANSNLPETGLIQIVAMIGPAATVQRTR
jgi:hypothetical protein